MTRLGSLIRTLGVCLLTLLLVGCQAVFGDFKVNDSAFNRPDAPQTGPIRLAPTKGLFTTEWGGQATFTIVLDYMPMADVTVMLSSSNPNEGTVSPASVKFTKDDWKAPQVVTVTGVNDNSPDGNQTYKIITAPGVSGDPAYNGKNAIDLVLVNVDNETAGITVVPRSGLFTSEAGAQDTFTVVLNSKPESDVTVSLVSDTPSEGTVAPDSLVFTPTNWMAPQLATITGADDTAKDGPKKYEITVASSSEDQSYAHVAPVTVEVTNEDNESAGFVVAFVSGIDTVDATKLRTSEDGESATFTVSLTFPPDRDVIVPISVDVPVEGQVSPDSLTFTPLNWNAPQTVTVMGLNDDVFDGNQPYNVVLGTPGGDDPEYSLLEPKNVPFINADDDKPGFTVMLLTGIDPVDATQLLTTEGGTTATFSLRLNSQPKDDVAIALTSGMPEEASVTPALLTFTKENWKSPQVVSVTGKNDDSADGSPLFFVRTGIAMSSDVEYVLDPPDIQVTNQDDDSAGVQVLMAKGIDPLSPNKLVTDENGSTATFTVALTSKPKGDVKITLSSSNTKEGTVSPATLTFTDVNFRAPQTVTVTGVQDDVVVDGNQPFSINIGAASSDDADFNGKFASQVSVTNRDDDSAGVIVTPTSNLVTSEAGKTDTFTVRLQSKPSEPVTIAISSNNPNEGKPNVSSVTFTSANWNANQVITVLGQNDDGVADGNATYKIILAPAQSKDPNYSGKPDPADVTVTNLDKDSPGIPVMPTAGLTTKENGLTATFTIVLQSKPISTTSTKPFVKIQLSSNRPAEGTVSPTTVTFDDVNWKSAQTVTITGVNDDAADGPQPYLILLGAAQSTDPNYNNRKPNDVSVTNADDDSANLVISPIPSQTPAVTTERGAGKSTFTVNLSSQPSADVTYTITSLDTTEGTVSPGTLKFTSANWRTAQTVTVTGVDDEVADGGQQYAVRVSNGVSNDPGYSGKFGLDLPFVNTDDDDAGFDISPTTGLKTAEKDAGTATFTVALLSQPTASVKIDLTSSNTAEGTVSPASLTFTAANWSKAQTVTLTGVQDTVADGAQTYQVKLSNAVSTDPGYGGKFGTQLDVQNIDDDQVGFNVDAGSMLKTAEKPPGSPVTFNVSLKSKPQGGSVTLAVKSSNIKEGTVSPAQLIFTAANWDLPHPVTVTGVDDKKADGDTAYQVQFSAVSSDDPDYEKTAPLPVSLTNVDDDVVGVTVAPTMCSTTPGTTATFTIVLNSQPSADVTIALSSDTPALGTVSPESVTFTSAAGISSWDTAQTVTVTGAVASASGMYTIVTGNAVATGDAAYNGLTTVADVMCSNTASPPVTP